jgi:DUF4097 and DUF4098 domain-containing protein YvlB
MQLTGSGKMAKYMTKSAFTIGLLVMLMSLPAFGAINKSVTVGAGEESDGASSINGSVTIGDNAIVTGKVSTVNGSIRIGEGARVKLVKTTNGSLRLADRVEAAELKTTNGKILVGTGSSIQGDVGTTNGSIKLDDGCTVGGTLRNTNGDIELEGSEVAGDVSTTNGDVEIMETVLKRDLVVRKPGGWSMSQRKPRVVIGPGSRVEGDLVLEREVELLFEYNRWRAADGHPTSGVP